MLQLLPCPDEQVQPAAPRADVPCRAARFAIGTSGGCINISDALEGIEDAGQLATYRLIITVSP